eukprot:tig00020848_g14596.t1
MPPRLYEYQEDGVRWLLDVYTASRSCILGDEMGLGKTIQALSFLSQLKSGRGVRGPYLVLCPLSLMDNWKQEIARFEDLSALVYAGNAAAREELRQDVVEGIVKQPKSKQSDPELPFDVLLTTYELAASDAEFLARFQFRAAIVDEAHRLKNRSGVLYRTLRGAYRLPFAALLTGTPVQNNLRELFALLHFVDPAAFPADGEEAFCLRFGREGAATAARAAARASADPQRIAELHELMRPYFLRRTKADVALHLPTVTESVLAVPMTPLQRQWYRSILRRNAAGLAGAAGGADARGAGAGALRNVVMSLRKCCAHPYLFDGVEPEPFEEGEHLVEASGKLLALDRLLPALKAGRHRVLLFSQLTRMLDVLQDYLSYRGHSYLRLDGSVRGEERYAAVQKFRQDEETFCFLLSTRAGGLGLNLVEADTVIFCDCDWNPQADAQAMARVHRLGQTRDVAVLRLVAADTVEEVMLQRALRKLRLTRDVVARRAPAPGEPDEEGGGGGGGAGADEVAPARLMEAIKFGLRRMLADPDSVDGAAPALLSDEAVEAALRRGPAASPAPAAPAPAADEEDEAADADGPERRASARPARRPAMRPSDYGAEDGAALAALLAGAPPRARARRRREGGAGARRRREADPEAAAAAREAKRAKREADERRRRERREAEWAEAGYTSLNLPSPTGSVVEEDAEDDEEAEARGPALLRTALALTTGRAGRRAGRGAALRDGGRERAAGPRGRRRRPSAPLSSARGTRRTRGGFFGALSRLYPPVEDAYARAAEHGDLALGDAHLLPPVDTSGVLAPPPQPAPPLAPTRPGAGAGRQRQICLVVAQKRGKGGAVSAINAEALAEGLRRVAAFAERAGCSVHMPRLGYGVKGTDWYAIERTIRRCLRRVRRTSTTSSAAAAAPAAAEAEAGRRLGLRLGGARLELEAGTGTREGGPRLAGRLPAPQRRVPPRLPPKTIPAGRPRAVRAGTRTPGLEAGAGGADLPGMQVALVGVQAGARAAALEALVEERGGTLVSAPDAHTTHVATDAPASPRGAPSPPSRPLALLRGGARVQVMRLSAAVVRAAWLEASAAAGRALDPADFALSSGPKARPGRPAPPRAAPRAWRGA